MKIRFPKISISADRVLSLSALTVSAITVFFQYKQTYFVQQQFELTQEQTRLAVLPYLEFGYSMPDKNRLDLFLINNGLGPAYIKDIDVTYNGKTYNEDLASLFHKSVFERDSLIFIHSSVYKNMIIPAGKRINMITVENDSVSLSKILTLWENGEVNMNLKYSSIYDEIWEIDIDGNRRNK